ncbi:MAG: hypothetical protein GX601_03215 [Anaerolineales bacterium]|nr:hypothetical protein [Anaerolineales bacterium]
MSRSLTLGTIGIMLVLSLLSGVQSSAWAQSQDTDITMTIAPYLGGHVKYGEWLTLRIRLENHGGDADVEVQSTISGSNGQIIHNVPVPLPAGARKQVVLYVKPPTYAKEISIELVSQGEVLTTMAVKDVTMYPYETYIVGALAPESAVLGLINGVVLADRGAVRYVPLTLDDIPDRFEPLRSLDCLIVSGLDTTALTPAQAEALRLWVAQGGHLVIGGGAAAERTLAGLSETLRPVTLGDVEELETLDGLEAYAEEAIRVPGPFLAALPTEAAGTRLITQDGHDLLVRQTIGEGWVAYLALDPAASPFGAWTGTLNFWTRLLTPDTALPTNIPRDVPISVFQSERMIDALTNISALELPSITWLALMLGTYIVLIGPVNYLVLKRFRRLSLAWVTIPLITAAFSISGYLLGYGLRGNDVIVNEISVLELEDDEPMHLARSYIGVFSPTRATYDLEVEGDPLISLMSRDYGMWSSASMPGSNSLKVIQGSPVQVRGLEVNQWSMQSFQAETMVPAAGGIEADLYTQDDRVEGTIRNDLDIPLTGLVLVSGRRFAHLGDLATGEERTLDVPLKNDEQGYLVGSIFQEYYVENEGNLPQETSFFRSEAESREVMLRQRILEAYLQPFSEVPVAPGQMVIFGWTDIEPMPVHVTGVRASIQRTALVLTHLPLPVTDGRIELPAGHLLTQVIEMNGEAGECGPGGQYYVARGQVTVEYRLPTTLAALQPTGLTLQIGSMDVSLTKPPKLYLYDWTADEFVQLEQVERLGTDYAIEKIDRYLPSGDGALRVRLENDSQSGGCFRVDFALKGRLESSD